MQTNWARVKLILLETFIKNFWGFSASFVLLLFSSFLWNTYMYLIYICFINITSIIHTYIVCQIHLPPYVGILRNLIHRLPGKVFSSFLPNFDDSSMKPLDPLMRQVNTALAHDENMYT